MYDEGIKYIHFGGNNLEVEVNFLNNCKHFWNLEQMLLMNLFAEKE